MRLFSHSQRRFSPQEAMSQLASRGPPWIIPTQASLQSGPAPSADSSDQNLNRRQSIVVVANRLDIHFFRIYIFVFCNLTNVKVKLMHFALQVNINTEHCSWKPYDFISADPSTHWKVPVLLRRPIQNKRPASASSRDKALWSIINVHWGEKMAIHPLILPSIHPSDI